MKRAAEAPGKRREESKQRTREALVEAATELIGE